MKKIVFILSIIIVSFSAYAQNNTTNYESRYNLLVSKLGFAGVGVETVLNNWEAADSLNPKVHIAFFNYWFAKSRTQQVVSKVENKYLGMKPLLTLKDSLGVDVYYFQEDFFDDQLYGNAIKSIDKAIGLSPDNLDYRFIKTNAYIAYEKGSPDMALAYLKEISSVSAEKWNYAGKPVNQSFMAEAMQEYCYSFYSLGTTASMEAFRSLSEHMIKLYPNIPDFQNNIGAYYLIGKNDSKKAIKQYNKVLKNFPKDYTALKNCAIISRKNSNLKAEKKYLVKLLEVAPETEKPAIKARLEIQ